jgi:hypothetical protein
MISEIGTRSYQVEGGCAPIPGQAANDRSSPLGRGPLRLSCPVLSYPLVQEFQTICNFPAIVHIQAAFNCWIINREGQ